MIAAQCVCVCVCVYVCINGRTSDLDEIRNKFLCIQTHRCGGNVCVVWRVLHDFMCRCEMGVGKGRTLISLESSVVTLISVIDRFRQSSWARSSAAEAALPVPDDVIGVRGVLAVGRRRRRWIHANSARDGPPHLPLCSIFFFWFASFFVGRPYSSVLGSMEGSFQYPRVPTHSSRHRYEQRPDGELVCELVVRGWTWAVGCVHEDIQLFKNCRRRRIVLF